MEPGKVGHYDISGSIVDQQPSNIYNIPDYPKPPHLGYKPLMLLILRINMIKLRPCHKTILYDASSCPVNWRMFEIQNRC